VNIILYGTVRSGSFWGSNACSLRNTYHSQGRLLTENVGRYDRHDRSMQCAGVVGSLILLTLLIAFCLGFRGFLKKRRRYIPLEAIDPYKYILHSLLPLVL